MKWFLLIVVLAAFAVFAQYRELQRLKICHYTLKSRKIKKPFRIAVLSDLHCHVFGRENEKLVVITREAAPDLIVTAGDMVTAKEVEHYGEVLCLLKKLRETAPVYYGMGNHESRVKMRESKYYGQYMQYEQELKNAGICVLDNETAEFTTKQGDAIMIYGLTIPQACYEKRKHVPLPEGFIEGQFGKGSRSQFQLLLAHNPSYARQYVKWGADVTFSGHNHGGLVRIPGIGSVVSPQFELFPEYDRGMYPFQDNDGSTQAVIVSAGMGTHTFHIRIFNRAEYILVDVLPET